ncbi:hypothetical protein [Parvularcula sp. LCG005]|uniref:hypothetical protein n=1 Tax=Parvularcula sp. LCG005 TaxID=3078805 RepID=UPI0029432FA2|nr:hypothetical protein [Parvularcula sp. LCG005]WOI54509.1 hypothetical protein RUI03_05775 [Parvularcula sp. LCG005]
MSIIFTFLGITLFLVGLITVFLPLPIGLICIVLGIALLVASNKRVRQALSWARAKFRRVDMVFDKAQEVLPEKLSKPMRETDPHENGDASSDSGTGSGGGSSDGGGGDAKAPPNPRPSQLLVSDERVRRRDTYRREPPRSRPR